MYLDGLQLQHGAHSHGALQALLPCAAHLRNTQAQAAGVVPAVADAAVDEQLQLRLQPPLSRSCANERALLKRVLQAGALTVGV